MWEVYRLPLRGNFSLRALVALFAAAILTTLFGALLSSQPVAAAPEKAEWQGDNVLYDAKEYTPDSTQNIPGIPPGATVFSRKDEANGKVSVLYYPQGTDTTKDIKFKVVEYTLNNDGTYSSPGPPTDHTLEAKTAADNKTTQCSIAGVGWIVCTLSRWIASGMDAIFKIISDFLEVQPISTKTDSGLYKAWEIGRSIANLCFVLAFLMIIYAQITSQGLSNYEIKKMIPKLIIAAILVNLSYIICGIAVDVSNILGHGVQQSFVQIRQSLAISNTNFDPSAVTWKNMTDYILSAGAIGAGLKFSSVAFGSGAVAGSFTSLGLMLVPILVGALIAVLIAVLILAARQALIIILIVVSPLAFVAMLLPNTEKWFDKWKDIFTTMLLVFPLFSLLFGGSQLASHIILQNTNQLSVMLLALFIQAAPLVLTPFLVKFSGSLLGRFAGMLDNPKKGLVDRTRNWATDKAEARRGETWKNVANGKGNRWQRKAYQRAKDQGHRDLQKKMGNAWLDASLANDGRVHASEKSMERAKIMEHLGKAHLELEVADMKVKDDVVVRAIGKTNLLEDRAKNLDARREAAREEARAGHAAPNSMFAEFAADAAQESRESRAIAQRSSIAQAMQASDYADVIEHALDPALVAEASGIDSRFGKSHAVANAIKTRVSQRSEGLKDIEVMLDVQNLSSDEMHNLATGVDVVGKFTGDQITHEVREVAIKKVASGANVQAINKLGEAIDLGPGSDEFWRTAFVDNLKGNSSKPAHYSASLLDQLGQGKDFGRSGVEEAIITAVKANKFDAKGMISNDPDTLGILNQVLATNPAARTPEVSHALQTAMREIIADSRYRGAMGNRKNEITNIMQRVGIVPPADW